VTDASGNILQVKFDPATLEAVDGEVVRFGDDGGTPRKKK
jgi:plastocyanin